MTPFINPKKYPAYTIVIQLVLFVNCFCYVLRKNILPANTQINMPNGPLDLPKNKKINLGLNTYTHTALPHGHINNDLQLEIIDDIEKLRNTIDKTHFPFEEAENYSTKKEMYYDYPPWLADIVNLSNKSKNTLMSLGVENLPDVDVCKQIKNLKEQILCIIEALETIKEVYENAKDITSLTARVLAGGRLAIRALSRLKTLASLVENRHLMKTLGTPLATLILLQRETTSDRNRWLAGSILTLLTDLPVVSDLADIKTGSYGHVNIIMPRQSRIRRADKMILELMEGGAPSSLLAGYATPQEYTI